MSSLASRVLLALPLMVSCATAEEALTLSTAGAPAQPPPAVSGAGGAAAGSGIAGAAAGRDSESAGQAGTSGGTLGSDVFGSGLGGSAAGSAACESIAPGTCDFTRLTGCCSALACERANGADVFNLYPVESCQALIACVQAHPGCSTASDPLCFGAESPDAPCLEQGYRASHEDPDGPFAWTADLVRCACGY